VGIILRDYQAKAIQLLRQSLGTKHRTPVLQCATGSGKTVIAGEIIKMAREKEKKVAFIVDRLTLIDQASEHLDAVGVDHGVIQATHPRTNYDLPVQVVSAQTLERRRPWGFDLAIVDECHCQRESIKGLIAKWDAIPFIGLSATPWGKGMGKYYDDLIIPITIHDLIDQGYLVDPEYYGPSEPDMSGVKITGGDYNQKQAAERSNKKHLVANIIDTWKTLGGNKQTLAFATDVAHSKHIAERFNSIGIPAMHIDAYTDSQDRRDAIKAFNKKELRILSSVGVLTTGFDSPIAEIGILARPTKSLMLHYQMIGRVLRPFPGKAGALILDHAGNCKRLGFVTDPTPTKLDMGHKKKKGENVRKEPLPSVCGKCFFIKPPKTHICPKCGFAPEKQDKVQELDGSLKVIKRKSYTPEEKMRFYQELVWWAQQHGHKPGWVYYKYSAKFGVEPHHSIRNEIPLEASEETRKWIQSQNIRYAHRRRA